MKGLTSIRSGSNRWKVYVLLGVIAYGVILNQVTKFRPDHAFLGLVILSFLLGKSRAKLFLKDWAPFVLFWIAYDMMRGVADTMQGHVHVAEVYNLDLTLFGWIFGGKVPPFFFQDLRVALDGLAVKKLIDVFMANIYTLHFAAPLLLGWVFWHTLDDRKTYYKFVYTLTLMNVMALITFMLFPVAPPWYVMKYGFIQPEMGSSYLGTSAGSLIDVDKLLGVNLFSTVWDSFNPNHFAAVPSLHGAYPVVISFFALRRLNLGRWRSFFYIYPGLAWIAAMYLNHHYLIDLIWGATYFVIAFVVIDRIVYPRFFAPFLDRYEAQTPRRGSSPEVASHVH